ncbi:MAG: hypothetical protein ACOCV2_02230 [Persicimonas sp.]
MNETLDDQQKEADQPEEEGLEGHRSFVREMNRAFGAVYGYGGAAVLAVTAAVPVVGWWLGELTSPLLWLFGVIVFLGGLYVLRMVVRRRAGRLHERIERYCEANELSVDRLREHFHGEATYPYFDSIFEVVERGERNSP